MGMLGGCPFSTHPHRPQTADGRFHNQVSQAPLLLPMIRLPLQKQSLTEMQRHEAIKHSAKTLSQYLRNTYAQVSLIDKLKIVYRPYICPLGQLLEYAKFSKNVFDVGCGSGQFLLLLAHFGGMEKLGGIEISERLISNARKLLANPGRSALFLAVFDGKTIPAQINEYDWVTMIDVFHHIPPEEQIPFMMALHKAMKPGAVLIFKDINQNSPLVLINKFHDAVLGGGAGREISAKKAEIMLTEIGFRIGTITTQTTLAYPHYTIVCKKT